MITERMWARVLSSTNQPSFLSAKDVIVEDKREAEPPTQILDEEKDSDNNAVKKEVSHM